LASEASMKTVLLAVLTILVSLNPLVSDDDIFTLVKEGKLEELKTILAEDSSAVSLRDENGMTPLHWAVHKGQLEICRILLAHGADPNLGDKDKDTPLHAASYAGKKEIVGLLLANGANPDQKNSYGRAPLHQATYSKAGEKIVGLLIKAGADINIKDTEGSTPLRNANWLGFERSLNLLLDAKAELPQEKRQLRRMMHYAALNNHSRLFKALEAKGIKLTMVNDNGGSLLNSAAEGGALGIAEYLLEKGLDVDGANRYGQTPLHLASRQGHTELVKLLLNKGVAIDKRCTVGKTAYNFASEEQHTEVIALLEKAGCDRGPQQFPLLKGKYLGQKTPGEKPEVFALGIVSTYMHEHSSPAISPDGKSLYWAPTWKGPIRYTEIRDGKWTAPRNVPFTSESGDGEPAFSPDGSKLFFTSYRPLNKDDKSGKENIWLIEKNAAGWSDPKPAGSAINDYHLHWMFSLTANHDLCFASNRAGGMGQKDIYISRLKDGIYQQAENLGDAVNTSNHEGSPYISPDESYLLFDRIVQNGTNSQSDLFISYKMGDGSWSPAQALQAPINSDEEWEWMPIVSPDQNYLFYIAGNVGNNDIFWVKTTFIEKLAPEGWVGR
jgi:ankyrin repeat protein/Tol biopolymer transport system component